METPLKIGRCGIFFMAKNLLPWEEKPQYKNVTAPCLTLLGGNRGFLEPY